MAMRKSPSPTDACLRATILEAFASHPDLACTGLRVGVLDRIVHLAGLLDSLELRCSAELLASQEVPGVRGVVNRIAAPGGPSPARKIDLDCNEFRDPPQNRR